MNALYGIKDHVWQTDGVDSTGMGVAPNFGCCTANMQQGWSVPSPHPGPLPLPCGARAKLHDGVS